MVLILDDIRSLYNVGSIFRSADGFAIEKIYLCGLTGFPPRKEITKTALGAEEVVPYEYRKDIISLIKDLKKEEIKIISLEKTEESININNFSWPKKSALVLGNEILGVNLEVLKKSDFIVHIEMKGIKESFNVSCASAIAMYAAS
jgi:23S rRNA (guanosine2251-2'-O)-methyltransferase